MLGKGKQPADRAMGRTAGTKGLAERHCCQSWTWWPSLGNWGSRNLESGRRQGKWRGTDVIYHPLQPPWVHRMPLCSGTWTVAVLLLITLTARKHSLVINSLIHPLLAFPVHPLLGQQQKYFAWKLLISANHLKGAPPLSFCTTHWPEEVIPSRGLHSQQPCATGNSSLHLRCHLTEWGFLLSHLH